MINSQQERITPRWGMTFFEQYAKEIVALTIPFIAWVLNVGLKAKVKLIWTSPHSFTFLIQQPLLNEANEVIRDRQTVHTASIRVINVGRQVATKVELVFNWSPMAVNIWPVRSYETKTDGDNRHILIFDNLSYKEQIGLEIISINRDNPDLLQVRCAECQAELVDMMWIPFVSKPKIFLARVMALFGIGVTVYLGIAFIQFLVLKTPSTF
jgi:hypothetical protein